MGALGFPPGFEAADPRTLADLGIGKTVTLTSTYDHRIIQGAESGLFLAHVAECLMGQHGFYDEVFESLDIPYEPARWEQDVNAADDEDEGGHLRLIKQVHVQTLINMYRVRGHLIAHLDPLDAEPPELHPELDPLHYGLTIWDLPRHFVTDGLAGKDLATLDEILHTLRDAYCRTLGVEYMHIQSPEQKQWIQQHLEGVSSLLPPDEQRHILGRLNAAEVFERFLHSRYVGQKRFGLEGAESAIVLLDTILDEAVREGLARGGHGDVPPGPAERTGQHRRQVLRRDLRGVRGQSRPRIGAGLRGREVPQGRIGDVRRPATGGTIPISMASNPSHLEAVDPVVVGMARAKQDALGGERGSGPSFEDGTGDPFPVLSILLHGDAAFAGQGVVAETLNLSGLAGYRTGGTVHIVINNQLGFTTAPEAARTSVYPTDVAKMVQAPIFHVNGDDPEACARAARLAFGFRQAFHKDVVIDMVCYRRHGHNEGDDPSYTQPLMYALIEAKRSVRKLYTESLVRRGDISLEEAEQALDDFSARLAGCPGRDPGRGRGRGDHRQGPGPPRAYVVPDLRIPPVETGVDASVLARLAAQVRSVPEGFVIHPKLARQFEQRDKMVADGEIDWALGEALAIGSLLLEGTNVRLTGQDTRRGTFSQRHAVLVDHTTGDEYVPLAGLWRWPVHHPGLAALRVRLRRASSTATRWWPTTTWWPGRPSSATSGTVPRSSWTTSWWRPRTSGARSRASSCCCRTATRARGPSTPRPGSSASSPCAPGATSEWPIRRRRPSTSISCAPRPREPTASRWWCSPPSRCSGPGRPARPSRRSPRARSLEVLDDPTAGDEGFDRNAVERVVLCTGKVAYDALARRDELGEAGRSVAVVRVEQLYPWPKTHHRGRPGGLPPVRGGGVAPGGAREHGGLELRPPTAAQDAAELATSCAT